mgnify:CR=1 FL=1
MPGGDRTGPLGEGPMTGRAAGFCTGGPVAGFAARGGWGHGAGFGPGRGGGWGRGRGGRGGGWGFRHGYRATGLPGWARWGSAPLPAPYDDPAYEKQDLTGEAEILRRRLAAIETRLADLDEGNGP